MQTQWLELKLAAEKLQSRAAELELASAAQHEAEAKADRAEAAAAKIKAGMPPHTDGLQTAPSLFEPSGNGKPDHACIMG